MSQAAPPPTPHERLAADLRARGLSERLTLPTYTLRKKLLTLFGAKFHIFDEQGELVLYSKMKAFRLKEDIRLYADQTMQQELLTIRARQIIDLGATYDVVDAVANESVGSLKRKAIKSFVRDEWIILDPQHNPIGLIREDSGGLAFVRRFIDFAALFLPQKFEAFVGDRCVATYKQNYNPFIKKLAIDFAGDVDGQLDRRLGLAAALLLGAIEGRQG